MAGPNVEVGSGYIRVIAKTLPEDYQKFKREWRSGMERIMNNLNLDSQLISNSEAQQQGQQAGTQLSQGMESAVQQNASDIVEPVAQQGNETGSALGRGIVAGVIAAKTGQLIAKGLGTAMELEGGKGRLQASLGLSPEDAAKYSESIKSLFEGNYAGSLGEAESAVGAVISSIEGMRGASNEAVTDMTKNVLTMSDAFGVDAARGAQVLGQLVTSGMVKDAEEGANLLVASMQKVPAAVREDVLDVMDEYSYHLAAMGITGQDAFEMVVKASEKGSIGIDKFGDLIKEFGIRAVDGSTGTREAYEAIGLNADEMTAKLLAGGEESKGAFNTIVAGLLAIEDPTKRAAESIKLFGTPLEDLSTYEVPELLKSLQGVEGALGDTSNAADKASDAMGNSFESQRLSAINTLNMALSEATLPLLESLIPIMKDLAKWVSDNKELISQWAGPLLVIGSVVGTVVAALSAFQVIGGVLMPIIGALTAAQWTWNAALFASPLFLWTALIAGIILAVILLATHWEEVTTFIGDSINWIGEQLAALGSWFSDLFADWGQFFGGGFNASMNVSGGGAGGLNMPKFANGGLVTKPTVGLIGEAGNEVILNEGVYNARDEATTNLINSLTDNSNDGVNVTNVFPNIDPREAQSIFMGQLKLEAGF